MEIAEVNSVHKSYGNVKALVDVSFSVNESEIFGFIGPDGSGKTTIFRLLSTLLLPDRGEIRVLGKDCLSDYREIRKKIGYMPGRFSLYQDLTVEENLRFYATVFGTTIRENYYLISDIYSHIEPFKDRLAGRLSGGMKQKLALSCALIHKPALLILDEPTTGVDAVSRVEFWEMLHKLQSYGITILVSTPYMDEAMKCDRVALIQSGRLLSVNTPKDVKDGFSRKLFSIKAKDRYGLIKALKRYPDTLSAYPFGDSLHVTFRGDKAGEDLYPFLKLEGIADAQLTICRPEIEDRFLELMEKNDE